MNDTYLDTVRLLIDIAPLVFDTDRFAKKGGTAINLFLLDLPLYEIDGEVIGHRLLRIDSRSRVRSGSRASLASSSGH